MTAPPEAPPAAPPNAAAPALPPALAPPIVKAAVPPPGKALQPAVEPPRLRRELDPMEGVLPLAGLAAAVLVLAVFVNWYRRREAADAVELTPHDLMSAARDWEAEGEMTEEEYKKVKAKLAPQVRDASAAGKGKGDPARRRPPDIP